MMGHVKVTKIYDDHQEVVVDESNMITHGLVVDIVSVLTGEALNIPSLTPGYFQIGASGTNPVFNAGIHKAIAIDALKVTGGTVQHNDAFTVLVPAAAGGLAGDVTITVLARTSMGSTPSEHQIHWHLTGNDADKIDNLQFAINGTADTSKVKFGSGITNGATVGIKGITATDGTSEPFASLTADNGGTAGNDIALTNTVGTVLVNESALTGGKLAGGLEERTDDIFYSLSCPLSTTTQYGDETSLELEYLNRSFLASSNDGGTTYQEMLFSSGSVSSTVLSATLGADKQFFVPIRERNVTKNYLDSIEVRLELDRNTANGIMIREFGLFSSNSGFYKNNKPLLMAYKQLTRPFTKGSEFNLLIEWSIGFLANTNIYDNITPGFR